MEKILLYIGAIQLILSLAYSVALLFKGDHPDKEIEMLLKVTRYFSRK